MVSSIILNGSAPQRLYHRDSMANRIQLLIQIDLQHLGSENLPSLAADNLLYIISMLLFLNAIPVSKMPFFLWSIWRLLLLTIPGSPLGILFPSSLPQTSHSHHECKLFPQLGSHPSLYYRTNHRALQSHLLTHCPTMNPSKADTGPNSLLG